MKKIIYILILLFPFISFNVFAESWYQVEVIIFDRINPDLGEEKWVNGEPKIRPDMIELYPNHEMNHDQGLAPYMIMDEKNNRMHGIFRVLKLSREYRPLIHLSWQQPATKLRQSRYIHMKYDSESEVPKEEILAIPEEPNFIEDLTKTKKIIDGSIRIRSNFYLHVDLDIYYFKNLYNDNKIINKEVEFSNSRFKELTIQLKESRKIKLNEIHYFDNPLYGVILQVSRIEES
tara:strand:- start:359 stop:1057 length:699 start_codon:yes stop_codon:yes gene_type:complete